MLWLALHFPHLSLDLLLRGRTPGMQTGPLAVCTTRDRRQGVHDRNRAAARAGIEPGMELGAALSLTDRLQVHPRDEAAETAALEALAAWAGQFTPTVCLDSPAGLVLEIGGSLTLSGGLKALRIRIARGLRALGYRARGAVAPAPAAARLLARAGHSEAITDHRTLAATLQGLPVTALECSDRVLNALCAMGLRTIGDCLHLPRDGMARRLGPELLQYLDRALGRAPDPRVPYRPPARFCSRLLLPAEITDSGALVFAAHRLVQELSGFLLARDSGVQELTLELVHRRGPATSLPVGMVRPGRDAEHLLGLLREHLDRCELAAPVEAVELHAEHLIPLEETSHDLFARSGDGERNGARLIERLRARLGEDAVRGLHPRADHRPEHAWAYCAPGQVHSKPVPAARPLWLLQEPAPLKISQGLPWLDGRLVLRQGPERIEGGWWEGADVARDYFVAEGPRHERLWIFRELRKPQRWFLHGIFG